MSSYDSHSLFTLGRTLTGEPLIPRVPFEVATGRALDRLRGRPRDDHSIEDLQFNAMRDPPSDHYGDPDSVGWTYMVADDAKREQLQAAIAPLAAHRGADRWGAPLVYRKGSPSQWLDWLNRDYFGAARNGKQRPRYILLVGNPQQIPFELQALLQTVAFVGRLDFDDISDLQQYVEKVLRLDEARACVPRSALIFAPDHGHPDPTYFSHRMMMPPLRNDLAASDVAVTTLLAEQATKCKLTAALASSRHALIYTASHGVGVPHNEPAAQRIYNGAICCQERASRFGDDLFTADDVLSDQPFHEGSVFFQFGCFGYGTPEHSAFEGWVPDPTHATTPVVSALPKRLLANPRGPIAYIGHVDLALLLGFSDGTVGQTPHPRMAPFQYAARMIFQQLPVGYALKEMHARAAVYANVINSHRDRVWLADHGKREPPTEKECEQFIQNWLIQTDGSNYMVLGDPAVSVRFT